MSRSYDINNIRHFTKYSYLKYSMIFAGLVAFNSYASCGSSGGTIDSPTTADCEISDANGKLTINSDLTDALKFSGNNTSLIIGSAGVWTDNVFTVDGMAVTKGNWSLKNDGTIKKTATGGGDLIAISAAGDYSVENNGSISRTVSSSDSNNAYSNTFEIRGASGINFTLNNNGVINNDVAPVINDIAGNAKIVINNNKDGVIKSPKTDIALKFSGDASTNTVTITNAGEISAKNEAIHSEAKTIIYNSGKIAGESVAISLGSKNDELYLDPTSDITGAVKAGDGTDTLTLRGEESNGELKNVNDYQGFEKLVKEGANTWMLSGKEVTFTDSTQINSGNLLMNPDVVLTSKNVTINQGATLGGYGTVKGNVTNSGTLAIGTAAPGFESGGSSDFTINGNYTGNNGSVVMNMALNDDITSSGSKLVITGDTAGTTNITINNVGGNGGQTVEGIEVVDVGGKSDGEFIQNGRIVAGAYDYNLVKGKSTDAADGNWYLTSYTEPTPEPTPEPQPEPQPKPPVRPEAGAYLGNQAAAKSMFMSTMRDRMGEQNFTQTLASDDLLPSTWLRTSGSRTENKAAGNIDNTTDSNMFQLGSDITAWSANGTDRGHVGFMFGYGYAKTESYSAASKEGARHATGKAQGYNTGLYGTWFADAKNMTGLYVDSWLQYSWFDNEVKGDGLGSQKYDSDLWQGSVETGYTALAVQNGEKSLYIEPQAQVIYTSMNTDDFNEVNGTRIHDADASGYTTRLGMRIFGRTMKNNTAIEPFIEANWWHDSSPNSTKMNSDKVYDDTPASRYEMKGGVEGKINNTLHSWANVGYQTGENDYSEITGMVGVKYIW